MSNYLNQIESDLYKLNSITNGSGEVVEMVAELKEKYEKAKAFDYILGKKNEVEDDIYKFAVVREESAYQYLGYEVFKFIDEYESGDYDAEKR